MWFKNLFLYRFTQPFTLSAEQLDEKLSAKAFHPVGSYAFSSTGWSEPLGEAAEQFVHTTNGCMMICLRREERIMPAAAVRELLDARAREIEERDNRKIRGKARASLREAVMQEMLPRAFTKNSRLFAYIDAKAGWLVVDTASVAKADEFVAVLRETLEQLKVAPLAMQQDPGATMTSWLKSNHAPGFIAIQDECELRDPMKDGGVVRVRRQDLNTQEIRTHLDAGKMVARLALTCDERISFVLDSSMALKRLRFHDVVMQETGGIDSEGEAARFDADFAIMSLELARLLPALLKALGGEAVAEERDAA
jgi:recombination associated protein RdgC